MKKLGKRTASIVLSIALAAMPMTSYGGIFKSGKEEATQKENMEYQFKSGDTVISMGAEAGEIVKALGNTTKAVFEQDSCAYQGKDRVYTYQGFEMSTYPADGKEKIASIYFLDSTVSTPEGIKIGSTKKEVLEIYGTEYDQEEAKFGTFCYSSDTALLRIYTTKDVVDGIEYLVNTPKQP